MLALELRYAVEAAPREKLSELSAALWKAFGAGAVTEEEAGELSDLIEARKAVGSAQAVTGSAYVKLRTPLPRKTQRPPIRSVAVERRRRWAAAGRMPPKIASHFTLGEQAALAAVTVEVVKRGKCTLALDHIAAVAGVSRATVRNAMKQARLLGFITVEERRLSRWRNDTNVVRIISKDWLAWMRLARRSEAPGGGRNSLNGMNTKALEGRRERRAEASESCREKAARSGSALHLRQRS